MAGPFHIPIENNLIAAPLEQYGETFGQLVGESLSSGVFAFPAQPLRETIPEGSRKFNHISVASFVTGGAIDADWPISCSPALSVALLTSPDAQEGIVTHLQYDCFDLSPEGRDRQDLSRAIGGLLIPTSCLLQRNAKHFGDFLNCTIEGLPAPTPGQQAVAVKLASRALQLAGRVYAAQLANTG